MVRAVLQHVWVPGLRGTGPGRKEVKRKMLRCLNWEMGRRQDITRSPDLRLAYRFLVQERGAPANKDRGRRAIAKRWGEAQLFTQTRHGATLSESGC